MWTKRIAKPTGWVVDMRHYLDEETGDLPEAIPERVLSLPFSSVRSWPGSPITSRKAIGSPMCRAAAVLGVDGAAARSSPNSTRCRDTSSGIAHSAAITA